MENINIYKAECDVCIKRCTTVLCIAEYKYVDNGYVVKKLFNQSFYVSNIIIPDTKYDVIISSSCEKLTPNTYIKELKKCEILSYIRQKNRKKVKKEVTKILKDLSKRELTIIQKLMSHE